LRLLLSDETPRIEFRLVRALDTLFWWWDYVSMMDLNDLRVFEKVASLRSFSAAARALGLPKSSVSRSIARLEAALGVRLCQRTTRKVVLTEAGGALMERCAEIMGQVEETVDYFGGLAVSPRGALRISAGIGFGVNVLSEQLPQFLRLFPNVSVTLDLRGQSADLIGDDVDVAIRMGAMPDSQFVAVKLGSLSRHLCASPAYLERRGMPATLESLILHDRIETPGRLGRPRPWTLTRGDEIWTTSTAPRICVNDALTIHRMVINGAGIGVISGYLCGPDIAAGRLVRLFPEWLLDPLDVNILFPSRRDLSPIVRAFVDFMKVASKSGASWLESPLGN
jgi:DNA-binding transcriptional LysR family regulator